MTQARMFATYHVADPPPCSTAKATNGRFQQCIDLPGVAMSPYYMIMRLPGQTHEEFVSSCRMSPTAAAT